MTNKNLTPDIYITHHFVEPSLCMVPRQWSKNKIGSPCIFSLGRGQHHQVDDASHVCEVKFSRERELNISWLLSYLFSSKRGSTPNRLFNTRENMGRGKSHDGNLFLNTFFPQLDKGLPIIPYRHLGRWDLPSCTREGPSPWLLFSTGSRTERHLYVMIAMLTVTTKVEHCFRSLKTVLQASISQYQ